MLFWCKLRRHVQLVGFLEDGFPSVCTVLSSSITIFEKAGNIKDNVKVNGRGVKREMEKKESDVIWNNNDKNNRGLVLLCWIRNPKITN
jgi:hypothetical protein